MTLEDANKIVAKAQELELDVELRENYSARGMMGKTTAGVVGNRYTISEAAQEAGVKISGLKWDSMGRQLIAY